MNAISLDATDCRILTVLQQEGRISNLDLAERISLSPSACLRRLRLLEEQGAYVGPGHWFETPDRHFRIGYGWPTSEELAAGLTAISAALRG